MPDCQVIRDNMPLLLTESLDALQREQAHQHIEGCALCEREWADVRQTWAMLDELPEVPVPPRARQRFLSAIAPDMLEEQTPARTNVVPFHRRRSVRWLTQAAAVVIIAGGSWFAGHKSVAPGSVLSAQNNKPAIQAAPSAIIPIAETRVLSTNAISPNIEGRPDISNLQFVDGDPSDDKVGVSFDITSRWTVTGSPRDKSMVRLLSYVLENDEATAPRSQAMKWVQKTYSDPAYANPEIASALAKVLRNDQHEGVRIRAVETLMQLPSSFSAQTRDALIEALKTDPNPAVRIKAVEALANLARDRDDAAAVDTLRETAARGNENTYVRVKAAEALSTLKPQ